MEGVRFKGRETTVKLDRPRREPREDRGDFRTEGRGEGRGSTAERAKTAAGSSATTREYRGAKPSATSVVKAVTIKRGPRR